MGKRERLLMTALMKVITIALKGKDRTMKEAEGKKKGDGAEKLAQKRRSRVMGHYCTIAYAE